MDSGRLRQRWLAACVAAGLLANLIGGFSFAVTAVFVAIYLTGAALIGRGDEDDEDTGDSGSESAAVADEPAEPDAELYPDIDESETAKSESESAESGKAETQRTE